MKPRISCLAAGAWQVSWSGTREPLKCRSWPHALAVVRTLYALHLVVPATRLRVH